MLQYLVTSKVRRRLLALLWGQGARGSVAHLAKRAGVSVASAHAELHRMAEVLLVVCQRENANDVYSANLRHPDAATLRALVASDTKPPPGAAEEDALLKAHLRSLGAPLRGVEPVAVSPADELQTFLRGVRLARKDPSVARTLPLCVWRLRNSFNAKSLKALSVRPEEKHAVAFFLALTAQLANDVRLGVLADNLKDERISAVREFFQPAMPRRPGAGSTFPLAEAWGFQMSMDLESFKSVFDKFMGASE